MTPGIRDLHEDPGDELHRVDPLALGRFDVVVSRLGQVDDLVRAGGEVQPREAHRGSHHVADERLELAPIAGMHENPVVHGETASSPRIQQIDPLLAQQPSSAEQSEHLVSEERLGRSLIHIRQRDPLPRSGPAAPRTQRVDVRVELRPLTEGLDHRHHPRAKALLLHGRRRHQLLDGLLGGQRERAEKLAVVQEVDPQHLGNREHPLGMAHLLHDFVLEEGGELRRPLGSTRWAHSSSLAGEEDPDRLPPL